MSHELNASGYEKSVRRRPKNGIISGAIVAARPNLTLSLKANLRSKKFGIWGTWAFIFLRFACTSFVQDALDVVGNEAVYT